MYYICTCMHTYTRIHTCILTKYKYRSIDISGYFDAKSTSKFRCLLKYFLTGFIWNENLDEHIWAHRTRLGWWGGVSLPSEATPRNQRVACLEEQVTDMASGSWQCFLLKVTFKESVMHHCFCFFLCCRHLQI